MKRWIDKTVSFACTACGKCCKSGRNRVFVNHSESEDLAALLGISDEEFVQKYTFGVKDQNNRMLTSLKSNPTQQQCVFLNGNECSVYDARPTQCRTYPFWPQIMVGQAEWIAEAYNCEGIQIPAKQCAQIDEVALNMIIHQIHDRGAGEDWTYDEARALLEESISEDPNMVEDYLDGFYEETESRLVYESPLLRVVDCKVTLPALESAESNQDEGCAQPGTRHAYSRRMEFVHSARLAQTEVYLHDRPVGWDAEYAEQADRSASHDRHTYSVRDENVEIDASRLHMPVHRVLATLCVTFLTQAQQAPASLAAGSRTPSIAVIGAGCCALPSYLQSHASLASLTVHAVEPSAEVLDVALRYFGANFTSDTDCTGGLVGGKSEQSSGCTVIAHMMDGSQYLREAPAHHHDVIIIDAFADAQRAECSGSGRGGKDGGEGSALGWGLCAPPQALLQDWPQLHAALTRDTAAPPGLLLMNVYGPAEWVDHVARQVEESGLFGTPTRHAVAGQDSRESETTTDAPGAESANVVLSVLPKVQ